MKPSTLALPGRASVAIGEPISVDLAGIVVHEVHHRSETFKLCFGGTRESTKEFVFSAEDVLIRGEVRAIMDANLAMHVESLDAIPHLVRRMELHDHHAVLLFW
jgi:hypothetical protein